MYEYFPQLQNSLGAGGRMRQLVNGQQVRVCKGGGKLCGVHFADNRHGGPHPPTFTAIPFSSLLLTMASRLGGGVGGNKVHTNGWCDSEKREQAHAWFGGVRGGAGSAHVCLGVVSLGSARMWAVVPRDRHLHAYSHSHHIIKAQEGVLQVSLPELRLRPHLPNWFWQTQQATRDTVHTHRLTFSHAGCSQTQHGHGCQRTM